MKVFISWSGERSKHIAEALRGWLPKVIQAVEPWMSQEDIASGGRWYMEVANDLESSNFGILCVTPENESNPWIMFEAGSLSKTLSQTFLCPYLYDIFPSQLSSPLAQFQAQQSNKEGTKKILKSINTALNNRAIEASELEEIFEVWWPKLEQKLNSCPQYGGELIAKRSNDELISEIVDNTREQLRREEIRLARSEAFEAKLFKFTELFENILGHATQPLGVLKNGDINLSALNDVNTAFPEQLRQAVISVKDLKKMNDHFDQQVLNPQKESKDKS